ncbi:MAG: transglycosylase SLT domain-containing protein [Chloroflexota bacterium]
MQNNRNKINNKPQRKRRQTDQSTGCLSGFFIPLLIVLFIGIILASNTTTFSKIQLPGAVQNKPLAPFFTPEIQHWSNSISRWANEHSLDPNFVATVMQIESCGNPESLSGAGAAGLFQVMPFHFAEGDDSFDPDTNALRGLTYLENSLTAANGDYRLAFAGYNGGIGVISQPDSDWADETQRYAYWGSGIYEDAQQNLVNSPRLNEWLNAGGDALCILAKQKLGISQ